MGRLLAYLGPETIISEPVEGGTYGLLRQAEQHPDGFGIGWYPLDGRREPVRVLSRMSVRNADHLLEVPRRYASGCIVAEVRSVERGPAELSGAQPLAHGPYLFAFEGTIERFDEAFLRPLMSELSHERFVRLRGRAPAELLFALWLDALDGIGPDAMASALESVIARVQGLATDEDAPAALALVLTDGQCLLALRTATHGPPPPLYTTVADHRAPVPSSGRLVASEPTFPGPWQALDPHALIIFTVERELDPPRDEVGEAPTLA